MTVPDDATKDELIDNDKLVTVVRIGSEPLTERRLLMSYNEGGKKIDKTKQDPEWWMTKLPPFQRAYSVGRTPLAAIRSLARMIGWGKCHGFEAQPVELPGEWYYRFWSGSGTSMKAAGRFVPGGAILSWWK